MRLRTLAIPQELGNPVDAIVGEFHDQRGRIACPYSLQVADMLGDYKIHFATQRELDANGGVCKKCAAKIRKRGNKLLNGKKETPCEIKAHHNGDCHFEENHLVPIQSFDYEAVDRSLSEFENLNDNEMEKLSEALSKIFLWCFPPNGRGRMNTAAIRLAVIMYGFMPELFKERTLEDIAKEVGVTGASLSLSRTLFNRHFNIKFRSLRGPIHAV